MGEFELIRRYFDRGPARRAALGIGDDCAILAPPRGMDSLAVSSDMLLVDRHFFADDPPESIGHKCLAVNLSDLAACGAAPLAFTLALALPTPDEAWLDAFSRGLFQIADRFDCELVGGDTTRGPLAISITVFGSVPGDAALRRDRAQPGDDVWVSGTFGGPAWAVQEIRAGRRSGLPVALLDRLTRPQPRVELGLALRHLASAAIDVSDGLLGDLGHIAERSRVGMTLRADSVPVDAPVAALDDPIRLACAWSGGDVYELAFCAAVENRAAIDALSARFGIALTRIGSVEAGEGIRVVDARGLTLADYPVVMTTSAAEQRAPTARANLGFMRRRLSRLLGLGFGSGLLPKAPGTWGTLFAWICFAWLDPILGERGWSWWLPIAFVAGIWACARTAEDLGDDDPGVIVWDEIVAFWCVLFVLGGEFSTQLGAFVVFRVFDTLKPPPIGFVDARVKGGFGIMLDDIVAAAMTLFVFAIWRSV